MNVFSLFSGIGGMDLGLERVGLPVVGQVEINPYCQRVLAKHWPEVPRHDDVRTAAAWWLDGTRRPTVDVVAAGFPCQPASVAGARRGSDDDRWLWPETWDVIDALRPRFVLLENVPGLLSVRVADGRDVDGNPAESVGIAAVLRSLAEGGYDAQWDHVPASAVGAPHRRDRWWCIATNTDGEYRRPEAGIAVSGSGEASPRLWPAEPGRRGHVYADVADTDESSEGRLPTGQRCLHPEGASGTGNPPTPAGGLCTRPWPAVRRDSWWSPQPGMVGSDDGIPAGVDRCGYRVDAWERGIPRLTPATPGLTHRNAALGNAVVPQVAEHLGRILLATAAEQAALVTRPATTRRPAEAAA